MAIFDLYIANLESVQCIENLLLVTNRKSYMFIQLLPNLMTLNDLKSM